MLNRRALLNANVQRELTGNSYARIEYAAKELSCDLKGKCLQWLW